MNKEEFVKYVAKQNKCTKVEAEKAIDMFTKGITGAIEEGQEVKLVFFGHFAISNRAAREIRDFRTGQPIKVPAYKQVIFRTGKKLKDACNQKTSKKA